MLDHTIVLLGPYVLLLIGLGTVLWLVLDMKREIRTLQNERALAAAQASDRLILHRALAEVQERVREMEEWTDVLVPPTPPSSGMNLNKRTQVIRLSRRGESPENIAGALGLPRQEVELLLKIHNMALGALASSGAGELIHVTESTPAAV